MNCKIYLLENARRLSQDEIIKETLINADSLRLFYTQLLLTRSLYEASKHIMLKSVLYLKFSRSWQVDMTSRSYTFSLDSTKVKRRKLQLENVKAQTAAIKESDSDWNEDNDQRLNLMIIKTKISNLFAFSSFCFWMKYLECFFNCCIQKINTLMRLTRAFHLLQMIAGFDCSAHFVTLKNAIARYRVLASEEIIDASLDLSTHLYKVSLWTEHLKLINAIFQRFAHAYFTLLINWLSSRVLISIFWLDSSTWYQSSDSTWILNFNILTRPDIDLESISDSSFRLDSSRNRKWCQMSRFTIFEFITSLYLKDLRETNESISLLIVCIILLHYQ